MGLLGACLAFRTEQPCGVIILAHFVFMWTSSCVEGGVWWWGGGHSKQNPSRFDWLVRQGLCTHAPGIGHGDWAISLESKWSGVGPNAAPFPSRLTPLHLCSIRPSTHSPHNRQGSPT